MRGFIFNELEYDLDTNKGSTTPWSYFSHTKIPDSYSTSKEDVVKNKKSKNIK